MILVIMMTFHDNLESLATYHEYWCFIMINHICITLVIVHHHQNGRGIIPHFTKKGALPLLRSAVGKTHVLLSGLVMNYATSYFPLMVLGYPLDQIHLSIEALCVSHLLPLGDCHTHHNFYFQFSCHHL